MQLEQTIKKYDTYKDSGIEWIGKIPQDWNIIQIKNIFNIGRGRVISQLELDEIGNYPVYSSQTQNNGCLGYIKTYDFDNSQLTWTTDGANAGTIFLREGKHNCTNVCGTLQPKNNEINLRYMFYDLSYIAHYHKRQDTNGFKIMNNEMAAIKVCIPSQEEQQKIANYLDKKCGEVDRVVEVQKQIIEKLKEYKQSVITEAVTKGLDKNTPLKDSGIEYLGNIPNNWNIKRLRYLATCQNGISKGGEYFGEGSPFVSYGDVYNNNVLPINVSGLCIVTDTEKDCYSVKENDIFFTRTSETIEEIAITCVCKKTIDNATFAGFLIRVRPYTDELLVDFSKYYFSSEIHRKFFVKEMNLVTRASLSQELLKKLPVLIPKKEEQQQIADYLDKKCSEIDKAISEKEVLIEKLTQYKKSLIYECATGKRKVCA